MSETPTTLDGLGLSVRVHNCLLAEQINTVDELCNHTETDLRRVPNLGKVGIQQIKQALSYYNLVLKNGTLETFEAPRPMMGNKPTLRWSYKSGEGSIGNLENFRKVDWTVRADALIDWIVALEEEYTATLKENHEGK